jgi:hypothetical protein
VLGGDRPSQPVHRAVVERRRPVAGHRVSRS